MFYCNRFLPAGYNTAMYLEHFGLIEHPFSIAPDPRYLYMSERHREALAHLLYGMNSNGAFILLTGDVGTGKTTVSRCLLEQVPEDTNLALVLNPRVSAIELLQVICNELRIDFDEAEQSVRSLVDYINRFLLGAHAQGKKTVVLIEEAQNLDLDVLEQLRLLTNLETSERKLLQVILLGQPEFLDVLDRPELSQLAQRITARFHLTPLNLRETEEYIGHRLAVAGCRRPLFAAGVIRQLYKYSGGVPRIINVLSDRALLGCYVQNRFQVDKKILARAAVETLGEKKARAIRLQMSPFGLLSKLMGVAALLLLLIAGIYYAGIQIDSPSIIQQSDATRAVDLGQNTSPAPADRDLSPAESDSDALSAPVEDAAEASDMQPPERAATLPSAEAAQVSDPLADEPAKKKPLSYIQWPENSQRLRSNIQSFQALFERWQLKYDLSSDGTPCYFAETRHLSCLHERGGLDRLRQLNRPAVLKLYDDFNQAQYVALLALSNDTATIVIGQEKQLISIEQLSFYWKGEFSLLWRTPPGYRRALRPGSSGEAIVWLSRTMNQLENRADNYAGSFYTPELVERVKRFQAQRGLDDDGVVGAKTLIYLNQMAGLQAPQLEVD